jgi:niacin transporter
MIVGRIGSSLALILLGKGFGIPMPPLNIYLYGISFTALPGIAIQIILIPTLMKIYNKNIKY